MSTSVVNYCSAVDLIQELNLQRDPNNADSYILWQMPTTYDIIARFAFQGNSYTTLLFGDLTTNTQYLPAAQAYAAKWAALRLAQQMAINWQVSGFRVGVGNLSIDRLETMRSAMKEVVERLTTDISKYYTILASVSGITVVDAYDPHSPYIVTKGQGFFP
jgi:hypothetical protein